MENTKEYTISQVIQGYKCKFHNLNYIVAKIKFSDGSYGIVMSELPDWISKNNIVIVEYLDNSNIIKKIQNVSFGGSQYFPGSEANFTTMGLNNKFSEIINNLIIGVYPSQNIGKKWTSFGISFCVDKDFCVKLGEKLDKLVQNAITHAKKVYIQHPEKEMCYGDGGPPQIKIDYFGHGFIVKSEFYKRNAVIKNGDVVIVNVLELYDMLSVLMGSGIVISDLMSNIIK
jgi:hypothetical protein